MNCKCITRHECRVGSMDQCGSSAQLKLVYYSRFSQLLRHSPTITTAWANPQHENLLLSAASKTGARSRELFIVVTYLALQCYRHVQSLVSTFHHVPLLSRATAIYHYTYFDGCALRLRLMSKIIISPHFLVGSSKFCCLIHFKKCPVG